MGTIEGVLYILEVAMTCELQKLNTCTHTMTVHGRTDIQLQKGNILSRFEANKSNEG